MGDVLDVFKEEGHVRHPVVCGTWSYFVCVQKSTEFGHTRHLIIWSLGCVSEVFKRENKRVQHIIMGWSGNVTWPPSHFVQIRDNNEVTEPDLHVRAKSQGSVTNTNYNPLRKSCQKWAAAYFFYAVYACDQYKTRTVS